MLISLPGILLNDVNFVRNLDIFTRRSSQIKGAGISLNSLREEMQKQTTKMFLFKSVNID